MGLVSKILKVKDYGGEVSFSVLDDMFSVSVIIPIEI